MPDVIESLPVTSTCLSARANADVQGVARHSWVSAFGDNC